MYPFIFPDGDDGWHYELDHSSLQHTDYQLMDQDRIVNPILHGRSLGQPFLEDQFAKSELSRLHTICKSERNAC